MRRKLKKRIQTNKRNNKKTRKTNEQNTKASVSLTVTQPSVSKTPLSK